MKMMPAYTQSGLVMMPDIRIRESRETYSYEALRGYGYVMMVCEGGKPIGWIDCYDIGFSNVSEYLRSLES